MIYLKLFENFNKEDIDSICEKYNIKNYTINKDGTIDVDGNVSLSTRGLNELPLRFRNVTGGFFCSGNELTSLEGCPKSVGGAFYCHSNNLSSLDGSPKSVGRDFNCYGNCLETLEGGPEEVGGDFDCDYNKLKTLKGCPKSVGGVFYCQSNQLMTLEGIIFTKIPGIYDYIYYSDNPCTSIYEEWIDDDRRDELLDLMIDYDFLRTDTIIWDRLVLFYEDAGLNIPDKDKLEKYYTII